MKNNTGQDNIQMSSNSSKHMEVGAVEVKVKDSVAAVTKDNSEETIIMVIMTVVEAITISIMEVDRGEEGRAPLEGWIMYS